LGFALEQTTSLPRFTQTAKAGFARAATFGRLKTSVHLNSSHFVLMYKI
jgi:hypothetical protein